MGSNQQRCAVDSGMAESTGPGWIPESRVSTPESTSQGAVIALLFQIAWWLPAGVASQKSGPVAGDAPRFARQHRISVRKEPRYQRLRRFRFDHPPTARPDANCRRVSRPLDPGSDSRGTPEFGVASTARSSPEHMDFIACWIESVSPCGVSQEIVSSARRVLTLRLLHIDEQAASAASSRWHRNFKRICFRNVPARTIGIRS